MHCHAAKLFFMFLEDHFVQWWGMKSWYNTAALKHTIVMIWHLLAHREDHRKYQSCVAHLLVFWEEKSKTRNSKSNNNIYFGACYRWAGDKEKQIFLPCVSVCRSRASSMGRMELRRVEMRAASRLHIAPNTLSSSSRRDTRCSCTVTQWHQWASKDQMFTKHHQHAHWHCDDADLTSTQAIQTKNWMNLWFSTMLYLSSNVLFNSYTMY